MESLVIHRKFYTFRAFKNYAVWYLTKTHTKSKKIRVFERKPRVCFQTCWSDSSFLLGSIIDIKNVSNLTLVAGVIAYDATSVN